MVFNTAKGKQSWAMYADIGPSNQIGEGSMKLNKDLGLSDSPKTGGTEEEIIAMIYFPRPRRAALLRKRLRSFLIALS